MDKEMKTAAQTPDAGGASPRTRDKVKSLEELAALVAQARQAGHRVALCHGVFDLLHLGHVRHLEEARAHGDMLVVTITADEFVNKGPGRPVFSEILRAQMVAALAPVSYVAVNHAPTAVNALSTVQPSVYVKGGEYANASDDVTGGIIEERNAVEAHGGRIAFTNDITFSSSALINKYLGIYDADLNAYLEQARDRVLLPDLLRALENIKDLKVLLVGDTIIDEYRYVVPLAKAPKENMIATLYQKSESFAGGVVAAANHTAAFCAKVDILTALGSDNCHEELIRGSLRRGVGLDFIRRADKPTTRKTRFLESGYMRKLFEVYEMNDTPLDAAEERAFCVLLAERAPEYDLVIATDFGHGLITASVVDVLTRHSRFLAVNTQTNSGNMGYNMITRYPRADFICIDAPEARLAVGDKFSDIAIIAAEKLPEAVDCSHFIITQGKLGCVSYEKGRGAHRIPAFTNMVVDTVGAGDAFLAIASPLAAVGAPMDVAAFIGNAAGALKVGIVGHRNSIEKAPLVKFLTAILK